MKKGGFLRNVLDTIRSNQASTGTGSGSPGCPNSQKGLPDYGGQLKAQHFSLAQVSRHGFPAQPSALAFDPVQKIAAIGTKTGSLRVFGRPGVDAWAQHKPECSITHIKFIVNQGALVTVTSDESIHLWSLRGHNLKLNSSTSSTAQLVTPSPSPNPPSTQQIDQGISSNNNVASSTNTASMDTSSSNLANLDSDCLSQNSGDFVTDLDRFRIKPVSNEHQSQQQNNRQLVKLYTLKFQREHITCLHQTLMSKWLYIGTEKGNIHVANVETFELSGYSIAWNKAIELSRKTHPGSVIHISECPQDSNKLLIGYEGGCIVLWDLKNRNADGRYYYTENLLSLSWHYEGKQFIASHADGSLITWQTRSNVRPTQIMFPHAKSVQQQASNCMTASFDQSSSEQFRGQNVTNSARALNNELYCPINKVDWKTSKSNEHFLLFSGGLPNDGIEPQQAVPKRVLLAQQSTTTTTAAVAARLPIQQQSSTTMNLRSSPIANPATSFGLEINKAATPTWKQQQQKRNYKPTSLTVMYGKSITVLEMDYTIVDFITVCDNSPYENDASDPYAVIVLLADDLILIDLTSPGYPSFDSPYPASNLNESPVTCLKYLADCSNELIPFLYSNSQSVMNRGGGQKRGFSDKEWPINGGEWGQSLQSYPELVVSGHADGSLKFWDMSGVSFDLISKFKTSKLFNKPNKLDNSVIFKYSANNQQQQQPTTRQTTRITSRQSSLASMALTSTSADLASAAAAATGTGTSSFETNDCQDLQEVLPDDKFFAIEKIEYDSSSKRLLVAGALSQVIQFRLNKSRESSATSSEVATIYVDPPKSNASKHETMDNSKQQQQTTSDDQMRKRQHHHLLEPKRHASASGSTTSGAMLPGRAGAAQSSSRQSSAFKAEIICLSPLSVSTVTNNNNTKSLTTPNNGQQQLSNVPIYRCHTPPKVTALAYQAAHNILAYSDELGIVLVDIIQKSVILSATLLDLYSSNHLGQNRDISIQTFATNSILQQHHYGSSKCNAVGSAGPLSAANTPVESGQLQSNSSSRPSNQARFDNDITTTGGGGGGNSNNNNNSQKKNSMSDSGNINNVKLRNADGGSLGNINTGLALHKLNASETTQQTTSQFSPDTDDSSSMQQVRQSRFTTNSMFQRQLSTTALGNSKRTSPTSGRLFQRQATASQIISTTSSSASSSQFQPPVNEALMTNKQRASVAMPNNSRDSSANHQLSESTSSLLNSTNIRGAPNPVSPMTRRSPQGDIIEVGSPKKTLEEQQRQQQHKKVAKNKRIISRMLSISAIHTSVTGGASSTVMGGSSNPSPAHAANLANNSLVRHNNDQSGSNNSNNNTSLDISSKTSTNDSIRQQPDKIDPSFARSRSSSGSSTTTNAALFLQQQQNNQMDSFSSNSGETVLCICFLDPASVAKNSSYIPTTNFNNNPTTVAAAAAAAAAASVQSNSYASGEDEPSSTGGVPQQQQHQTNNYKSLNSFETSCSSSKPGQLALYLGTSQGYVLLVLLTMPDNEDNRILQLQSVNAETIPQAAIKLPGAILCLTSFAAEGTRHCAGTMPPGSSMNNPFSSFPSSSFDNNELSGASIGSGSSFNATARNQNSSLIVSQESCLTTFLTIVSEKQAEIFLIPQNILPSSSTTTSIASTNTGSGNNNNTNKPFSSSSTPGFNREFDSNQSGANSPLAKLLTNKSNLYSRITLTETSFVCRSNAIQMRQPDESCLVSYLANGNLLVHSLPKLQLLMDEDFVPFTSERISSSMCFSKNGHCLYQPSESELCKFTISSQYKALINDMLGLLYVPREMPEMPKGNFFRTLFSISASRQSDRDELFGQCSAGKPQRGVAKHISATGTAPSAMDKIKGTVVGTMGHDLRVAREGLDERGEKLGEIEDRTLQMFNQSEAYSQAVHQLAQKFKDKKWYQF